MDRGCQFQVWPRFRIREFQRERLSARGGAVFGGKHQLAVVSTQVEERIDPRVEIGGATETVARATISGDVLACVVDKGNGGAGFALKDAEVTEQCGDLTSRVFVDRMKPDEGIENQENRMVKRERGFEPLLIGDAVEAQGIGSNDTDIEIRQIEAVMPDQRFQAGAKGGLGIFSSIQEDGAG